ncbi:NSs [Niukluk phantom virus]|uniref:NSs n=1 Tax=Niukluk phantom virus TaxID=2602116 RepID=A0A5B8P8C0_9VIRU|nr:NSs [Niukluk phantom virus]QDZ58987.1 NSs [Niukluk phantom virus]
MFTKFKSTIKIGNQNNIIEELIIDRSKSSITASLKICVCGCIFPEGDIVSENSYHFSIKTKFRSESNSYKLIYWDIESFKKQVTILSEDYETDIIPIIHTIYFSIAELGVHNEFKVGECPASTGQ